MVKIKNDKLASAYINYNNSEKEWQECLIGCQVKNIYNHGSYRTSFAKSSLKGHYDFMDRKIGYEDYLVTVGVILPTTHFYKSYLPHIYIDNSKKLWA